MFQEKYPKIELVNKVGASLKVIALFLSLMEELGDLYLDSKSYTFDFHLDFDTVWSCVSM